MRSIAAVLEAIGWAEVVLCATLGTFAFYENTAAEDWGQAYPASVVSAALTLAMAAGLLSSISSRLLLIACGLLAHLPLFFSPGDLELAAATSFVALWLLVAWAAHHSKMPAPSTRPRR